MIVDNSLTSNGPVVATNGLTVSSGLSSFESGVLINDGLVVATGTSTFQGQLDAQLITATGLISTGPVDINNAGGLTVTGPLNLNGGFYAGGTYKFQMNPLSL